LAIEKLFADAGVPDGVFAAIVGAEPDVPAVVERIPTDDRIDAASLTGSDPAGSAVGALAGRMVKKSVLELGGSDPFVVLDDADPDAAVDSAIRSRFLNAGQSCLSAKRVASPADLRADVHRKQPLPATTLPQWTPEAAPNHGNRR
jgi:succinate-semialdehyde dehydrogenase/glutarate-semialdehyde dehydrogenase